MLAIALAVVAFASIAIFSDCGGTEMSGITDELVGEWAWEGVAFYTFNDNGKGMMYDIPIRWSTNNGVLNICVTPSVCRNICTAPNSWNYVVDCNTLNLTGRSCGAKHTYARRCPRRMYPQ